MCVCVCEYVPVLRRSHLYFIYACKDMQSDAGVYAEHLCIYIYIYNSNERKYSGAELYAQGKYNLNSVHLMTCIRT